MTYCGRELRGISVVRRLWADRGLQGSNCTKRVAAASLRHQPAIRPPHYRSCNRRQLSGGPGLLCQRQQDTDQPARVGVCTHSDCEAERRIARLSAIRVRHGTQSTGVPRQKGAGQPTARLTPAPRERSLRPNHPQWPSPGPPSKEAPPAGRHKLYGWAGGPATQKQ